ncbi:DUF4910 domain-containing protein [Candidatus Pelagibacter ubique]|nr:DUF4910 domain-containing protein [Candidatus Pelagibacter ubique]
MIKYYNLAKIKLFPICRSITGKGLLKSLRIIKKELPKLKIKKIKSGTKVFDWNVPNEWNVDDAYILDKNNNKIIDFKKNNLHLVGYSIPINKLVSKNELLKNLNFIKKQPNAIPYVTSYYKKKWGFSVAYNKFKKIKKNYSNKDIFRVVIKSSLNQNGHLNYGELILKGKSRKEILISTYICHPSMANNELSGPIVSMGLINHFSKINNLEKTLRFIFVPETIGSITYLNKNLKYLKENVIGGYNLSCIGDEREHSCMFSQYKNSPSDEAIIEAYKKLKIKRYKIHSFLERGSDERQYNYPGVNLPISSIFRSKYGCYPEYHTSLDNFRLVTLKGILGGYKVAKEAISIILKNIYPKCTTICEPQLGKRGLYKTNSKDIDNLTKSYFDFLTYSDGTNSITKISKLIGINKKDTKKVYSILLKNKLVKS